MNTRGVSRPMALQQHHGDHDGSESGNGHGEHMSHEKRLEMLGMHHKQTLWLYWTLPLLGLWLILAPFTFGHLNEDLWVDPSGGRGPWFAAESTHALRALRALLLTVSDVVCGLLLLAFGWRSLTPNRPLSLWACCFVGIWLTFAPILFWAPTAASYANDSLVGILVIALTILIPGMPNMMMFMQHGPATPPGWSYNPSSWPQRWVMILLGFLGFVVSRYLAMYQLGYTQYVWDPFFGFDSGTRQVLDSKMSHSLPISDAGLGTVSYTFEFLMGYMGGTARWRTMPWMVTFFGILVIPLGLTHIFLVISQPVVVHAWCTMCLLAALIMLPMIPLEVDEVVAMLQHFKQARRRGDRNGSAWAIFWKGGESTGCTADDRTPPLVDLPERPARLVAASVWGMSAPFTLIGCAMLGVLLMFFPAWFGIPIEDRAADVAHLGGALVVTVSVVSMGEVIRAGRYLNVALSVGVAIGPWLLGAPAAFAASSTAVAVLVAILSVPRGKKLESYGSWDSWVR